MNSKSSGRNRARWIAAACAVAILATSTACVKRIVKAAAFWRTSPAQRKPAPTQPQSGVRAAMQRQTEGAFDPATGDRRIQTLNSKLRVDPQDIEARLELARHFESYSMEEPALEQYTRVLNLDSESLAAVQGMARLGGADSVASVRAFLKNHTESIEAMSALGSLLDKTGQLAEAETLYRQALEREPDAAYLHNNLGYNLMLQNRSAAASLELRRALELNPRSTVARNNLGQALAQMGDRQGAFRVFLDGGADRATAHNNVAAVLLEQGQLDESRAELLQALEARSYFAPALDNFKLVLEKDRERHRLPGAAPFRPAIPPDWMLALPEPPAPREKRP